MLKKHGKELTETKGEDWLDDGFVLGVVMDLTAAGIYEPRHETTCLCHMRTR